MKVRMRFIKRGPIQYIGHLDLMRYFQKVFRRCGLDVAYSQGFNPHQILSFASPLGVGLTSIGEYLDAGIGSLRVITDENKQILEFEEKPEHPRSNLASMGIYIFSWKILREALIKLKDQPACDFGKHIIPYCHQRGDRVFAYEYNGYWKDVGTLGSYWQANMELIDLIPVFNLYEEFWKIYTKSDRIAPQFIASEAVINKAIMGEACEIYGEIESSVIGSDVIIEEGAVVRDSIIMNGTIIRKGAVVDKAIIAEKCDIGENSRLGVGEETANRIKPNIYKFGLVTVGEKSVIPAGVTIGKNTVITGKTELSDYPNGKLESGESIMKAGER